MIATPRSEDELIRAFTRPFKMKRHDVALGIGDDCGVLRVGPGRELAVTTDTVVEGVHFTRAFDPEEVGHKALAVNLSDLAAMGAVPQAIVCAIELPPARRRDVRPLARGMARLAQSHGVALVGGNFARARTLSITITAMGWVDAGRALLRSSAQPGDILLVSGKLGGAARALRPGAPAACHRRQRRPRPLIGLGMVAAEEAHAGIDVSDGLLRDLGHLLTLSGLAAHLDTGAIPIQTGASLQDALTGGEDYELLLAAPPDRVERLQERAAQGGSVLTAIGRCAAGRPGRIDLNPMVPRLRRRGWDHFAS